MTSGCDANNEADSSQHNWVHPDRFGDRIIFAEFFLEAPEQEQSPFEFGHVSSVRYAFSTPHNIYQLIFFLSFLFTKVLRGHSFEVRLKMCNLSLATQVSL